MTRRISVFRLPPDADHGTDLSYIAHSDSKVGDIRFSEGNIYVLCKASGAIQNGAAVNIDAAAAEFTASESTNGGAGELGDQSFGVWNFKLKEAVSAQSTPISPDVADGEYFWCLVWGTGHVKSSGAFSDGDVLVVNDTDGRVDTKAAAGAAVAIAKADASGANEFPDATIICGLKTDIA